MTSYSDVWAPSWHLCYRGAWSDADERPFPLTSGSTRVTAAQYLAAENSRNFSFPFPGRKNWSNSLWKQHWESVTHRCSSDFWEHRTHHDTNWMNYFSRASQLMCSSPHLHLAAGASQQMDVLCVRGFLQGDKLLHGDSSEVSAWTMTSGLLAPLNFIERDVEGFF